MNNLDFQNVTELEKIQILFPKNLNQYENTANEKLFSNFEINIWLKIKNIFYNWSNAIFNVHFYILIMFSGSIVRPISFM